jgi:hypothetical protein
VSRSARQLACGTTTALPETPPQVYNRNHCRRCDPDHNTRVSTAIKYLTQSTWSHSSLYVGPISGRSEPSGEPHVLVEADVEHGVLSAPASKYSNAHTRICRPVGLSADEIRVVTDFVVDRIGLAYDLRNTFDLLRYLLPTHRPQPFAT